MTQREADAVSPFDLDATRPDSSGYLAGFVSELPAVTAEEAWQSAGNARIEEHVRAACAAMTGQLRTCNWVIERVAQSLVWLPVWIYRYRYQETVPPRRDEWADGQDRGRKTGEPPQGGRCPPVRADRAPHRLRAPACVPPGDTATTATANAVFAATETARPTATLYSTVSTVTAEAFASRATTTAVVSQPTRTPSPTATPPRTPTPTPTPVSTATIAAPTATAPAFPTAGVPPPTASRPGVPPTLPRVAAGATALSSTFRATLPPTASPTSRAAMPPTGGV